MPQVKCTQCKNWRGDYLECKFGFRSASTAGGSAPDCKEHVWFCRDYEEKEEDDQYD